LAVKQDEDCHETTAANTPFTSPWAIMLTAINRDRQAGKPKTSPPNGTMTHIDVDVRVHVKAFIPPRRESAGRNE
jgi:hypothetical protein